MSRAPERQNIQIKNNAEKLKSVTFTIHERRKPIGESTYQHSNTCVYWRHPNLNDIMHMKKKKYLTNQIHTVCQTMLQCVKPTRSIHSLS